MSIIIGIPSGEVLTIMTFQFQILYNYGIISYDPELKHWVFYDKDEIEINKILEKWDI